jgi:hypothetical protein
VIQTHVELDLLTYKTHLQILLNVSRVLVSVQLAIHQTHLIALAVMRGITHFWITQKSHHLTPVSLASKIVRLAKTLFHAYLVLKAIN